MTIFSSSSIMYIILILLSTINTISGSTLIRNKATAITSPSSSAIVDDKDEGEEIFYDNFETGWGNYNDGGEDARRIRTRSDNSYAGRYAIQLRDNSGRSSSVYSNSFDIEEYSKITIAFTFMGKDMEFNEKFVLEYSTDNNNNWISSSSSYVFGVGKLDNNQIYQDVVTIAIPPDNTTKSKMMRIRFRCDASSNYDLVYIYEVRIKGIRNNNNTPPTSKSPTTLSPTTLSPTTISPTTSSPIIINNNGNIWINEFHYDNIGSDVNEFIEIAYTDGIDIASYQIILYNGNGGRMYRTINIPEGIKNVINAKEGESTVVYLSVVDGFSIQNGPDGIALVKKNNGRSDDNVIIEFISYEGNVFEATDGPASGRMSVDIDGKSESGSTPVGYSLQRVGVGCKGTDFTWADPDVATPGSLYTPYMILEGCNDKNDDDSPPLASSSPSVSSTSGDESPEDDDSTMKDVKVMTYNILQGGTTNTDWKEIVKKENADIVVFTEVGNWDDNNDELLNEYLNEFNTYFATTNDEKYYEGSTVQGGRISNTANAIMSRFPIVQSWQLTDRELTSNSAHDIMVWKLDISNENNKTTNFLYVFGIHLKCCAGTRNSERRDETTKALLQWIDTNIPDKDNSGIILMGDFNSVSPMDTDPKFPGYQNGFRPSSGSNLNDGPLRMLLDPNHTSASQVHTFKDAFREANPVCSSSTNLGTNDDASCCADTLCDRSLNDINCPERGYTYINRRNRYDSRIDYIIVNQHIRITGPSTVGDIGGRSVCTASDHLPVDAILSFF